MVAGEFQIEEARDVCLGKPQILGGQQRRALAEHGLCQVEAGRQFASGDYDVEARRCVAEQVVQQPDGSRVLRVLGLIERQNAGVSPLFECLDQYSGAGVRLADSGLPPAKGSEKVDAGFLEREWEMGIEIARLVVAR